MCQVKSMICSSCGNNTGEAISVQCNQIMRGHCRRVNTGTIKTNICEACNGRRVYTGGQKLNNLAQQMSAERNVYRRGGRCEEATFPWRRERMTDDDKHDFRRYGVESMIANAGVAGIPGNFGDNGHGLYGDHQPRADPYWLKKDGKPRRKESEKRSSRRSTRPYEPLSPISPISSMGSISLNARHRSRSPVSPLTPEEPYKPSKPRTSQYKPYRPVAAPVPDRYALGAAADIAIYPLAGQMGARSTSQRQKYQLEDPDEVARARARRHGVQHERDSDQRSFTSNDDDRFLRRDPRPGDRFRMERTESSKAREKAANRKRRVSDAGPVLANYGNKYASGGKMPKSAGAKSLAELRNKGAKATKKFFRGFFN